MHIQDIFQMLQYLDATYTIDIIAEGFGQYLLKMLESVYLDL